MQLRKTTDIRKKEIIDSVIELMTEQGISAITIKNIAKKNDITEGAIYRHFGDKHQILMELALYFEKALQDMIDEIAEKKKDNLQVLHEIMRAHLLFAKEKKISIFAVASESIHFGDGQLRARMIEIIDRYKGKIKKYLKEAIKEGDIRESINLDATAFTYFGMIQASIMRAALTDFKESPLKRFNTMWEIFIMGISAENQNISK